jgi:hypothetical protein
MFSSCPQFLQLNTTKLPATSFRITSAYYDYLDAREIPCSWHRVVKEPTVCTYLLESLELVRCSAVSMRSGLARKEEVRSSGRRPMPPPPPPPPPRFALSWNNELLLSKAPDVGAVLCWRQPALLLHRKRILQLSNANSQWLQRWNFWNLVSKLDTIITYALHICILISYHYFQCLMHQKLAFDHDRLDRR